MGGAILTFAVANRGRTRRFEPHRLPMDEMEYTIIPELMEKHQEQAGEREVVRPRRTGRDRSPVRLIEG